MAQASETLISAIGIPPPANRYNAYRRMQLRRGTLGVTSSQDRRNHLRAIGGVRRRTGPGPGEFDARARRTGRLSLQSLRYELRFANRRPRRLRVCRFAVDG